MTERRLTGYVLDVGDPMGRVKSRNTKDGSASGVGNLRGNQGEGIVGQVAICVYPLNWEMSQGGVGERLAIEPCGATRVSVVRGTD